MRWPMEASALEWYAGHLRTEGDTDEGPDTKTSQMSVTRSFSITGLFCNICGAGATKSANTAKWLLRPGCAVVGQRGKYCTQNWFLE
jgi:hypothetical protein